MVDPRLPIAAVAHYGSGVTERPQTPAQRAVLTLLEERGVGKTICPSEAARRLSPHDWRRRMEEVNHAVRGLADAGRIEVRQGGCKVDPARVKGPIRIAMP